MSKTLFLTSSPYTEHGKPFNEANQFARRLREATAGIRTVLFIASAPDCVEETEDQAQAVRISLELTGICFEEYRILDSRSAEQAGKLVKDSELIVLAGGHVPTQNAFFQRIGLRKWMEQYDGVVMGISAGTMNSADVVYSQPELDGESVDPNYCRFIEGLGLTKYQLLPHYQWTKGLLLDGKRLFEDITYSDSQGQCFYAIPDGTYLYGKDGREWLCGEAYRIWDGECERVCAEGDELEM